MSSRERSTVKRRIGAVLTAAGLVVSALAAMTATAAADHEPGHVDVTPLSGSELNKCQGAMPTPGSENTNKRLVGGSLVPGGTAVFEFTFPYEPGDTNGRDEFVILDCVFVDDEPALAYELRTVPNDVNPFVFQFTVDIPSDIPIGAEFCNVGKTTAAPSNAQGSNRKAGPACFVMGGGVRVLKTDPAGLPLTGATFSVQCTATSDLMDVVIEGVSGDTWTGTTGADNAIAIAGPLGTRCTVTETVPPPGYVLASPASVTVTISQVATPDVVIVNPPFVETGSLVVSKTTVGGSGSFDFTVDCTPGSDFDAAFSLAGGQSHRIDGIPTGTTCVVTEASSTSFSSAVTPTGGSVVIAAGDNTVAFTNTIRPPVLAVVKTADAASVTAGAGVGFTVTVASTGPNPALDVTLDDPLPGAAGVSWTLSPAYAGPGSCAITGSAPAQTLACSFGTMAPGATASVHVAGTTSAATTGTLSNTATARAANHDPVSSTATVSVNPVPVVPVVPTTPVIPASTPSVTPASPAQVTPAAVAPAVLAAAQPAPAPAPVPAPQVAPQVLVDELPRTGSGISVPLTVLGLLLIASGVVLRSLGGQRAVTATVPVPVRRRRR